MIRHFFSQIICQNSPVVSSSGPWAQMYALHWKWLYNSLSVVIDQHKVNTYIDVVNIDLTALVKVSIR